MPTTPSTAACSPAPVRPLLGAVHGLQIGVVTSLEDDSGEHRVRVRLPLVEAQGDGIWARVASLDAGQDRGFFFRPELGDEVVLGFLDNDPRHPVLLGMLNSSALPPPDTASDANPVKRYKSREGLELIFDDEHQVITARTPGGRQLVLDDDKGEIRLADAAGNALVLDDQGVTLQSATAVLFKSSTNVSVEVGGSFELQATADLTLEGGTGAELKSNAITKLTGSLVQIN